MDIGVVSLLTFFQGFLQYILGVARIKHTKKVFVVNTAVIKNTCLQIILWDSRIRLVNIKISKPHIIHNSGRGQ